MPPVYMALFVSHFMNNSEIGYVRETGDFTIFFFNMIKMTYYTVTKPRHFLIFHCGLFQSHKLGEN